MTPGFRLKTARKQAELTQQQFAHRLSERASRKIKRAAVAMWESNENAIPAEFLLLAAEILNKNPNWLLFGTKPEELPSIEGLSPVLANAKNIPLLSYEQVESNNMEASFHFGIDHALAAVISEVSFALQVKDTSMLPVLNPGDIIIVDPETRPVPGEIIVVKANPSGKIILGKYRPCEANFNDTIPTFEVAPINPEWPSIMIENELQGKIIGTLVEHRCRRRLPFQGSHSHAIHSHENYELTTD